MWLFLISCCARFGSVVLGPDHMPKRPAQISRFPGWPMLFQTNFRLAQKGRCNAICSEPFRFLSCLERPPTNHQTKKTQSVSAPKRKLEFSHAPENTSATELVQSHIRFLSSPESSPKIARRKSFNPFLPQSKNDAFCCTKELVCNGNVL